MPRRASLPGADLLFGESRASRNEEQVKTHASEAPAAAAVVPEHSPEPPVDAPKPADRAKVSSPRPRHEEKVTFYCTDSDLTRLEAARLDLRANHRLASDRGRIVRAAIAEILDDFDARGADSLLVKRLSSE